MRSLLDASAESDEDDLIVTPIRRSSKPDATIENPEEIEIDSEIDVVGPAPCRSSTTDNLTAMLQQQARTLESLLQSTKGLLACSPSTVARGNDALQARIAELEEQQALLIRGVPSYLAYLIRELKGGAEDDDQAIEQNAPWRRLLQSPVSNVLALRSEVCSRLVFASDARRSSRSSVTPRCASARSRRRSQRWQQTRRPRKLFKTTR